MISIEYRQDRTGSPVALMPVGDPGTIPHVGDVVFVPDSETPWVYAYLRVIGRQFFYDQHGALTMVSLTCESGPEHAPEARFQTTFAESVSAALELPEASAIRHRRNGRRPRS